MKDNWKIRPTIPIDEKSREYALSNIRLEVSKKHFSLSRLYGIYF